ncbi:MAG: phosphate ABC transporter permease PstA [Bacilli bacterium]|nr:phosphate ABC transporter permease PstA [Bacillales bacterium]MDY2574858.1 phosphate ABC transporter permease PstA [Bacilli bacterium]
MDNNEKKLKIRKIKDILLNGITYIFSSFGIVILIVLLTFIFSNGAKSLSWKTITSNYYEEAYFAKCETNEELTFSLEDGNDIYYSKVWGIGLKDSKDLENNPVVKIVYIDNLSPLKNALDQNTNERILVLKGQIIKRIQMVNTNGERSIISAKYGSQAIVDALDNSYQINELYYATMGGGIRGSLLTTLYLIFLTLIISLPPGIIASLYLSQFAKDNKLTKIIRSFIDMTSGIPSIIFGLVGVIVFIPIVNGVTSSSGGNIISGALTMTIMLLPTIIRTCEESLRAIPKSYTHASLALGASQTQTIMKVILPNSIPGILTSTLLALGRIIGESAALIFAIGSSIKDSISLTGSSTTLAVHIWSVLSGENPNYEQACAISILIIIIVLVLNVLVKLVSKKLNRFEVKS